MLQAFGAFRGAMTIMAMNVVGQYAAIYSKNEALKHFIEAAPDGSEAKTKGVAATTKEVFMLAYLCSCCLKGKKFKKIASSQKMMS